MLLVLVAEKVVRSSDIVVLSALLLLVTEALSEALVAHHLVHAKKLLLSEVLSEGANAHEFLLSFDKIIAVHSQIDLVELHLLAGEPGQQEEGDRE